MKFSKIFKRVGGKKREVVVALQNWEAAGYVHASKHASGHEITTDKVSFGLTERGRRAVLQRQST